MNKEVLREMSALELVVMLSEMKKINEYPENIKAVQDEMKRRENKVNREN